MFRCDCAFSDRRFPSRCTTYIHTYFPLWWCNLDLSFSSRLLLSLTDECLNVTARLVFVSGVDIFFSLSLSLSCYTSSFFVCLNICRTASRKRYARRTPTEDLMKSVSSSPSTRGRQDEFLSVPRQIECMSLSIHEVSEEMFLFLVRLIPFLLSLSRSRCQFAVYSVPFHLKRSCM